MFDQTNENLQSESFFDKQIQREENLFVGKSGASDSIIESVGVTLIVKNMVENRLRWFEHYLEKTFRLCGKKGISDGEESNNYR